MGLRSRNNTLRAALGAVRDVFRAIVVKRTVDSGLAFFQAKGQGDPDTNDDHNLLQESELDHVSHYGIDSYPPADTELVVVEADGGLVSLGERDSVPTSIPTRNSGDSCIYSAAGNYVFLDENGKLQIYAATGNVTIDTTGSGDVVLTSGSTGDVKLKFTGGQCTIQGSGTTGVTVANKGKVTVNTDAALGSEALQIDQNDEDKAFIDFAGVNPIPGDDSANLTTDLGDSGLQAPLGPNTNPGWVLTGLFKIEINGTDYWVPYYAYTSP